MSDTSRDPAVAQATAVAADGTRLVYGLRKPEKGGAGRIALVHSLAMTGAFWDPVAAHLAAAGIEVLTWDCRGHGSSDKPAGPYTVEQFADDLAVIFDAAGWTDAVVAGASMGGCVTLAFAAAHPDRVAGLGLIDTTAWYGPDAPRQWEERAEKGRTEGLASLVNFQKTRWFGDNFRRDNPGIVDSSVAIFVANRPEAYAETCRMLGAADLRSTLSRISVPTAILVGEEDYATPVAMAEAMHGAIPGASLEVIEGGRHLTPLEMPERVAKTLQTLVAAANGAS